MSLFRFFLVPAVLAAAVAGNCLADDTCSANDVDKADVVSAVQTEILKRMAPKPIDAGETTKGFPWGHIGDIIGSVGGSAGGSAGGASGGVVGNIVGGVVNAAVQTVIDSFVDTGKQAINSAFASVNTAVKNYSTQIQAAQAPLAQSASGDFETFVSQLNSTFDQAMTGYNQIPWSMLNVQAMSALLPSEFSGAVSALIAFNATLANSSQLISNMAAAGPANAVTQLTQLNGTLQNGLTSLSNDCGQVKSLFQLAISLLSTKIASAIPANVEGIDLSTATANLAGVMTVAGGNLNTTVDILRDAVAGFVDNGVGQAISAFLANSSSSGKYA